MYIYIKQPFFVIICKFHQNIQIDIEKNLEVLKSITDLFKLAFIICKLSMELILINIYFLYMNELEKLVY